MGVGGVVACLTFQDCWIFKAKKYVIIENVWKSRLLAHCENGVKYARFVNCGQFSPFLAISFVFYPIDNARRADLYIN